MNKPLFLRLFSTINFKTISLLLTLVVSSTLTTVNNNQYYSINTTDNNKILGFHITVTENNNNLVQAEKEWNKINDQYEDYVNNNQIINVPFNSWTDVINQFSTKSLATDQISIEINNQFQKQLLDSKIFPITAKNYFTSWIILALTSIIQQTNI